jgi:uncharacterized protein
MNDVTKKKQTFLFNNNKKSKMKNLFTSAFVLIMIFFAAPVALLAQATGKQSNVTIVQALYDHFGKGNIPEVLASMSANVEWNEAENFIYGENKPFVGPDAVVNGLFVRIGADWEYWTLVDVQFHNMDKNMVLATGRYQAKYKKNGALINAQFAHVITLKAGKVMKFQQYTDTKQFADAIQR